MPLPHSTEAGDQGSLQHERAAPSGREQSLLSRSEQHVLLWRHRWEGDARFQASLCRGPLLCHGERTHTSWRSSNPGTPLLTRIRHSSGIHTIWTDAAEQRVWAGVIHWCARIGGLASRLPVHTVGHLGIICSAELDIPSTVMFSQRMQLAEEPKCLPTVTDRTCINALLLPVPLHPQPNQPAFGAAPTPAFGATTTSGFGSTAFGVSGWRASCTAVCRRAGAVHVHCCSWLPPYVLPPSSPLLYSLQASTGSNFAFNAASTAAGLFGGASAPAFGAAPGSTFGAPAQNTASSPFGGGGSLFAQVWSGVDVGGELMGGWQDFRG